MSKEQFITFKIVNGEVKSDVNIDGVINQFIIMNAMGQTIDQMSLKLAKREAILQGMFGKELEEDEWEGAIHILQQVFKRDKDE